MKLKFGNKVRDKITGFEGILIGECKYATGCNQMLVFPPCKDGDFKESRWFDTARIEFVDEGITIASITDSNPGSDISAPTK